MIQRTTFKSGNVTVSLHLDTVTRAIRLETHVNGKLRSWGSTYLLETTEIEPNLLRTFAVQDMEYADDEWDYAEVERDRKGFILMYTVDYIPTGMDMIR